MQSRSRSNSVATFFSQNAEDILNGVLKELGIPKEKVSIEDTLLEDIKKLKEKYQRILEVKSSDSPRATAMTKIEEFKNLIEMDVAGKKGACFLFLNDHLSFEQIQYKSTDEVTELAKKAQNLKLLEEKAKEVLKEDAMLFNVVKVGIPNHLASSFMQSTILHGVDYLKLFMVSGVNKFHAHLTNLREGEFIELVAKQQELEDAKKSKRSSYNFSSLGEEMAKMIRKQISEREGETQGQAL